MASDWNDIPDEEFRSIFRTWVDQNCPSHLRYMRKQRPLFNEVAVWYHALAAKGWLAPTWPRQYGGMGLSAAKHMIYVEEWGRLGCPRIPDHGIGLVGPLLIEYGSEEQKAHYLPRILSGEHVWCQGYSEPNAGSDLASLQTSAVLDGDEFVVNGQKIWTTLAHCANWIFVLVRTERDAKVRQKGITVLLLDLTSPGVRVRPIANLRGEADFCEVFFDNVRVPLKNLVGKINEGWTVAKSVLGHERIFLGRRRARNMHSSACDGLRMHVVRSKIPRSCRASPACGSISTISDPPSSAMRRSCAPAANSVPVSLLSRSSRPSSTSGSPRKCSRSPAKRRGLLTISPRGMSRSMR